jgi:hypothetical protein
MTPQPSDWRNLAEQASKETDQCKLIDVVRNSIRYSNVKKVSGIDDTAMWPSAMTIEAARETQERAKLLVFQSRILIETTSSLISEARQLIAQTRARKLNFRAATRL